jgi:hypothetical protein
MKKEKTILLTDDTSDGALPNAPPLSRVQSEPVADWT